LITLTDVQPRIEAPTQPARISTVADGFLHAVLYVCILSSFFVFVQPAPYEYLAVLLGFACLLARVSIHRLILPLLILLLVRDASGAVALFQILDNPDSTRMLATSFYLGLTGVMFACLLTQDTMRRIRTLRAAYTTSAVLASIFGVLGYFELYFSFLPGLEVFSMNDRAVAGFKDPNVLGAFLIPPLTWLMSDLVVDKIRMRRLIAAIIIFVGLLLAFSRAAWGSSALSSVLLMYLLFVTQNNVRKRVIVFVLAAAVIAFVIFALLSNIDVVHQMFLQRFTVLQEYDAGGQGTRFDLQQNSLREMFDHPLGMGPWGFMKIYGMVSHNTFLGTMLNHGWVGGIAYLVLIVLSLFVGFRALWVRTPWQIFLIGTYLPFLALVLEGLVVDTDHWRHFYLLLGLVWGLSAATADFVRQQAKQSFSAGSPCVQT
jgi:hypothetical protein